MPRRRRAKIASPSTRIAREIEAYQAAAMAPPSPVTKRGSPRPVRIRDRRFLYGDARTRRTLRDQQLMPGSRKRPVGNDADPFAPPPTPRHRPTRRPRGRPTLLTDEIAAALASAIEGGSTVADAARALDLQPKTAQRWRRAGLLQPYAGGRDV